jgi:DNA-binding NtrC family response regulator
LLSGAKVSITQPESQSAGPSDKQAGSSPSNVELWVIDDDSSMCDFLSAFLRGRGNTVVTIASAEEAVKRYQTQRPAAIILDVMLAGPMDGLEALAAFKKIDHTVPVLVVSGQGRTTTMVQAMKLGAADFLSKPFDVEDLELPPLTRSNSASCVRSGVPPGSTSGSIQPRDVVRTGERMAVSATSSTVSPIPTSPCSSGRERNGQGACGAPLCRPAPPRMPFVEVNRAALPTELLESELFGFGRGAFTGAVQHKPGRFEFANRGTIFLDEVGRMSAPLQAKLLQVLQDGEFRRAGGRHDVRVDVRVISATNRDLQKAVAGGQFREDLFFRLNVVGIWLPPLRERRDEIQPLTEHSQEVFGPVTSPTPRSAGHATALHGIRLARQYPGARESDQTQSYWATKRRFGDVATASPWPLSQRRTHAPGCGVGAATSTPPRAPSGPCRHRRGRRRRRPLFAQRRFAHGRAKPTRAILRMLQQTHWNRKETAEHLGISYKALLYKIKEGGLDKAS